MPPVARKPMTPTQRKKARSASAHGTRIKATYNLTREEYNAILEAQGGACAICQRKPRYRLAVDHCHKTLEIRGLLCKLCNNRLLPAARDMVSVLLRAAEYLTNPPARTVLGGPHYAPPESNARRASSAEANAGGRRTRSTRAPV